MKHILALDTSGPSLSVALTRCDRLVYACTQQNGLTHSQTLMPLVDAALEAGGLLPADVDCFAVVAGPGSFTGVRIGVETAKALAHATGKPCMGVNALEALAHGVPFFDGLVCALQDARAGQVYSAAFADGAQVLPDAALPLGEFLDQLLEWGCRCCFVGDGAVAHHALIEITMGDWAAFPSASAMVLHASHVAHLTYARKASVQTWPSLMPYYLRAPQAERERLARKETPHA